MRIFLLLFSLSCLINAECGCEEVERELERDRKEDADFHACRSCKAIVPSAAACPDFGYECDPSWVLTTKTLTPNNCQCSDARCANHAKLAVNNEITNKKLRCNTSQWIVGDEPADAVVCAKSCDLGVCKAFHSKASTDFISLEVHPATVNTKCVTANCQHGIAVLDDNGSLIPELGNGITDVRCSSDGTWVYGDEGQRSKFVMCNAKPIVVPACKTCDQASIVINGAQPFLTEKLDTSGSCSVIHYVCEGDGINLNGDSEILREVGATQVSVDAVCDANKKWISSGDGTIISSLGCNR